jgi:hypothetical protein
MYRNKIHFCILLLICGSTKVINGLIFFWECEDANKGMHSPILGLSTYSGHRAQVKILTQALNHQV